MKQRLTTSSFIFAFAGLLLTATVSTAADPELLFADDFERNESQEKKDELGKGWGTNSRTRAKGNKQTNLGDGTMRIFIHETADHAVSVTHPLGFQDGIVRMRFKLEDEGDVLGLNFADLSYKKVHAGHLCMALIHRDKIEIKDLRDGAMRLDLRQKRTSGEGMSDDEKALVRKKSFRKNLKQNLGASWHDLEVTLEGETARVKIDGSEVGAFTSSGIAHPNKATLRLHVPQNVVIDDLELWKLK